VGDDALVTPQIQLTRTYPLRTMCGWSLPSVMSD
jgi:hypothetical protein